jgi:hypothetical protein
VSIPSNVTGAGSANSVANVFQVVFSQALSGIPTLESWDDSTFATTTKEQFAGTTINGNIPYVSAIATTQGASAPNWKTGGSAGGQTVNRLKGLNNYVNLTTVIPTAGGSVKFNLDFEIGADASVPSTNTFGVLAVRYSYSGAAPTLTFQFNDASAGGTEGAPSWTNITPGSGGNFIRPADAGSNSGSVIMTKPTSGVASAAQIWVTNS